MLDCWIDPECEKEYFCEECDKKDVRKWESREYLEELVAMVYGKKEYNEEDARILLEEACWCLDFHDLIEKAVKND